MAEEVTIRISTDDEASPALEQIASKLNRIEREGQEAGEEAGDGLDKISRSAKKAGDSTSSAMDGAEKSTGSFVDRVGGGKLAVAAFGAGALAAAVKVGQLATQVGKAAVTEFAQFEQALTEAGLKAQATETQLQSMRNVAIQAGIETKFSATEAAEGLDFLAMAGLSVEEQVSALPGTLELAAAANMELANAADIATNVLTAMQLPVSDLSRVNDALVGTAKSANTNVQQLGSAFEYAAPQAATAGIEVEELSAILGTMAQAGIRGSKAGRAVSTGLARIIDPGAEAAAALDDVGLNAEQATSMIRDSGFASLLETIEENSDNAARTLIQVFGQEAGRSIQAVMNQGASSVKDLNEELKTMSGVAGSDAEKQMDTLQGSLTQLEGSTSTLLVTIGERLAPEIRSVSDAIRRFTNDLRNNEDAMEAVATVGRQVGTAFKGATNILQIITGATKEQSDMQKRLTERAREGATAYENFQISVASSTSGMFEQLDVTEEEADALDNLSSVIRVYGRDSREAREAAVAVNKAMGRGISLTGDRRKALEESSEMTDSAKIALVEYMSAMERSGVNSDMAREAAKRYHKEMDIVEEKTSKARREILNFGQELNRVAFGGQDSPFAINIPVESEEVEEVEEPETEGVDPGPTDEEKRKIEARRQAIELARQEAAILRASGEIAKRRAELEKEKMEISFSDASAQEQKIRTANAELTAQNEILSIKSEQFERERQIAEQKERQRQKELEAAKAAARSEEIAGRKLEIMSLENELSRVETEERKEQLRAELNRKSAVLTRVEAEQRGLEGSRLELFLKQNTTKYTKEQAKHAERAASASQIIGSVSVAQQQQDVASAFSSLQSNLGGVVDKFGKMEEGGKGSAKAMQSAGGAAAGFAKGLGASAAEQAGILAAFEMAAGFASLATPGKQANAPLHFISAGLYAGIAGASTASGGGGGGPAPQGGGGVPAAAPSADASTQRDRRAAQPDPGATVTIYDLSGATLLEDSPVVQDNIHNASEEEQSRRLMRRRGD